MLKVKTAKHTNIAGRLFTTHKAAGLKKGKMPKHKKSLVYFLLSELHGIAKSKNGRAHKRRGYIFYYPRNFGSLKVTMAKHTNITGILFTTNATLDR